ncbi:MAG: universal stress protein, partial [Bacteroidales bacterium]|nr:universal stress protein [Bacteroidales bacterium]
GDKWDEVQLSGIKEYFKKQYPEIESSYCVIRGDNLVDGLNDFIQERKIDVLALPAQRRNLFSRLFNPSIAHKVLFHTDTPVLVLRG